MNSRLIGVLSQVGSDDDGEAAVQIIPSDIFLIDDDGNAVGIWINCSDDDARAMASRFLYQKISVEVGDGRVFDWTEVP